jgi:hypothetical protein
MLHLEQAMKAWGTPEFERTLKQILAQEAAHLPLQQGLCTGNYVSDAPITVSIQSVVELENRLRVRAGIFYQGILGGCSCSDDPTPNSDINEYCEVQIVIDMANAAATVTLLVE